VSALQIVVILAGLFIGYRLVSHMMSAGTGESTKRSSPPPEPPESPESESNPKHGSEQSTGNGSAYKPPKSPPLWYQVLNVEPSATREEIDRAYRKQISQYHPDKVATMGEEIRLVAESRTKEINKAYDLAMQVAR
jgi:hypothetical protein